MQAALPRINQHFPREGHSIDTETYRDKTWYLYMVRCPDDSIYTGISTDVQRRFAEHQAGKGAKYLRGKLPLTLVYQKDVGSHSDALKIEILTKKLSKAEKEALFKNNQGRTE